MNTLYTFKQQQEEHDNEVPLPDKFTNVDNIRVCLENLDDYLRRKRGISGVPLAAYTREDVNLPLDSEDPGFGTPSILKEMIRCAPHTGATYYADNEAVWDAVQHVAHEGPAWGWVQSFARQRNGRGTYLVLKQHYLGDTFQARLRSCADQIIETIYYDGMKQNFSFEKYIETLQKSFVDLESTGEHISEERKVRILLNGISDNRLEAAKNQVLTTQALHDTFENATNFLSQVLDSKVSYSAVTCKA